MHRSPYAPQDDHLRALLDQRNARADIHGRFSSISEYSDSPSVYSRAQFSPNASDGGDYHNGHSYTASFPPAISHSGRENQYDAQVSMLDLEDDRRTSYAPSEAFGNDNDGDEDKGTATRMSYLGPKMRFHSRAPWEMDEGTLEEEEEPEENHRHFPAGFPFSRAKSSTSGSSSPRPSYSTSRPSGESSRSQIHPKRSFETISSQVSYPRGALYALAQESMSTSSLGRQGPLPQPPKDTLRTKFSFGRLRPEPTTAPPVPPSPMASPARNPVQARAQTLPPAPIRDQAQAIPRSSSTNYEYTSSTSKDVIHPYANPDLVVSFAEERVPPSPSYSTTNFSPSRSDSNFTVTETSSSADSVTRSTAWSTLTPDSSLSSVASRHRVSSVSTKTISSPVSVIGPPRPLDRSNSGDQQASSLPQGAASIPGWTDRNSGPTFALISLEEARAQRMGSSSAHPPSRLSSATTDSTTPFPGRDTESFDAMESSSTLSSNLTSRSRGRSVSAGARAKNALHTMVGQPKMERRETEPVISGPTSTAISPAGKTIKHKKSGFMRLFNNGKEIEENPPPVPSLPEVVYQHQPFQQRTPTSVARRPVPSLSPSLVQISVGRSNDTLLSESNSWNKSLTSPKRALPSLSINTISQGMASRASTSAVADVYPGATLGRPWTNDQPQSAPANVSEFPALKLRPVSTLFSAHFGDHIVLSESRSSGEMSDDLDTPRSPSPVCPVSPVTPGFYTRTSNDAPQIGSASVGDNQSVVKALQEQMNTAKKAWQRHIWELEGQVRDLKAELDEVKLKNTDAYCDKCGRGKREAPHSAPVSGSVVNRPRIRTGTSSRFGNPLP